MESPVSIDLYRSFSWGHARSSDQSKIVSLCLLTFMYFFKPSEPYTYDVYSQRVSTEDVNDVIFPAFSYSLLPAYLIVMYLMEVKGLVYEPFMVGLILQTVTQCVLVSHADLPLFVLVGTEAFAAFWLAVYLGGFSKLLFSIVDHRAEVFVYISSLTRASALCGTLLSSVFGNLLINVFNAGIRAVLYATLCVSLLALSGTLWIRRKFPLRPSKMPIADMYHSVIRIVKRPRVSVWIVYAVIAMSNHVFILTYYQSAANAISELDSSDLGYVLAAVYGIAAIVCFLVKRLHLPADSLWVLYSPTAAAAVLCVIVGLLLRSIEDMPFYMFCVFLGLYHSAFEAFNVLFSSMVGREVVEASADSHGDVEERRCLNTSFESVGIRAADPKVYSLVFGSVSLLSAALQIVVQNTILDVSDGMDDKSMVVTYFSGFAWLSVANVAVSLVIAAGVQYLLHRRRFASIFT